MIIQKKKSAGGSGKKYAVGEIGVTTGAIFREGGTIGRTAQAAIFFGKLHEDAVALPHLFNGSGDVPVNGADHPGEDLVFQEIIPVFVFF